MTSETRKGAFFARHGRKLAYSLLSPSTIVTTGAIAAAAIAGGLPLAIAGAVTAGAYAIKVAAQTFTGKDLDQIIRPEPKIDVKRLRQPYRGWVEQGLAARRRFEEALQGAPAGPLRDRLGGLGTELGDSLDGIARAAGRAQQIDDYLSRNPVPSIQLQLDEAEGRTRTNQDPQVRPDLERVVASLREQLRVAKRLKDFYDRSVSRISTTIAQIDQLTAQLMEVLLTAEDAALVPGPGSIDDLVAQMESVRMAVRELDPNVTTSNTEAEVQAVLEAQTVPASPVAASLPSREREGGQPA